MFVDLFPGTSLSSPLPALSLRPCFRPASPPPLPPLFLLRSPLPPRAFPPFAHFATVYLSLHFHHTRTPWFPSLHCKSLSQLFLLKQSYRPCILVSLVLFSSIRKCLSMILPLPVISFVATRTAAKVPPRVPGEEQPTRA